MDDFGDALRQAWAASTPIGKAALEAAFVEPERPASISGGRKRDGLPPMRPVGERPKVG
jgi:hypothetical protein